MNKKIYCTNCGRQVVNRDDSTNLYVGSTTVAPVADISGVICHECQQGERLFYELLEGKD